LLNQPNTSKKAIVAHHSRILRGAFSNLQASSLSLARHMSLRQQLLTWDIKKNKKTDRTCKQNKIKYQKIKLKKLSKA
jgi:hypothetical protein